MTVNNYPSKVIDEIIEDEVKTNSGNKPMTINNDEVKCLQLVLPYAGHKSETLLSKLKKQLKSKLPTTVAIQIVYQPTKLSSRFSTKDKLNFNHRHNIVYQCKCANSLCNEVYIGETNRRIIERIKDHNLRDKASHVLNHSRESKHQHVWIDDFTIIGSHYRTNIFRKIREAFFIKAITTSLNIQGCSYPLKLYN